MFFMFSPISAVVIVGMVIWAELSSGELGAVRMASSTSKNACRTWGWFFVSGGILIPVVVVS
jgi:hypothetical protein